MGNNNNVLTVSHLSIRFDGQEADVVHDVSISLQSGEVLAIVGESGSGKSLTAHALMGLLPNKANATGECILGIDNAIDLFTANDYRGNRIGIIFQEPMTALNPVMTIGDQISEAITIHQKISAKEAHQKTLEWLKAVLLPDPETTIKKYPHQLSGGQKQRVMIAMAMCNNPELLIADEPTTALDVTVQKEIVSLLKKLAVERGTATIFITHDIELAGDIADSVLVLYKGKVVDYGKFDVVKNYPESNYTKALFACRPNEASKGFVLPTVDDILAGRNSRQESKNISITAANTMVDVSHLTVEYQSRSGVFGKEIYKKAVDDVSLQIRKFETLGLVGESGCGKSTIGKAIMGLTPIASGTIGIDDDGKLNCHLPLPTIRKKIQYIFQDPYSALNPRLRVDDMLKEVIALHFKMGGNELQQRAEELMEMVQLPKAALLKYPHEFSGGQRQRLGIARALALKPEMLICDESVSALDVSVQAVVLNLLQQLKQDLGLSMLFISHDLNVVHYISDRVLVMQAGKIVEEGLPDEILQHPKENYTKMLIAAMPGKHLAS